MKSDDIKVRSKGCVLVCVCVQACSQQRLHWPQIAIFLMKLHKLHKTDVCSLHLRVPCGKFSLQWLDGGGGGGAKLSVQTRCLSSHIWLDMHF